LFYVLFLIWALLMGLISFNVEPGAAAIEIYLI
jgi:hypothetical protein